MITPGPADFAPSPITTKIPVPMMAPTPSAVSATGPMLLRRRVPSSSGSATRAFGALVANTALAMSGPLRRPSAQHRGKTGRIGWEPSGRSLNRPAPPSGHLSGHPVQPLLRRELRLDQVAGGLQLLLRELARRRAGALGEHLLHPLQDGSPREAGLAAQRVDALRRARGALVGELLAPDPQ